MKPEQRYFVSTNPELEAQVASSHEGMAHWSGTGPSSAACKDCAEYGDIGEGRCLKKNRCRKYYRMMKHVGGAIPPNTPSCRHFRKPDGGGR
jgi:hypothetical protein